MTYVLFIYAGVVVVIGLFGGVALYVSRKYGSPGDKTRLASALYLAVFAIILMASFVLIGSTDFSGAESL